MLVEKTDISFHEIQDALLTEKQVSLHVLRLDKIHPIVSGNKLFKLHYFLEEANQSASATIVTFGGAYSNHLVATAYTCKKAGLQSVGFIRGERQKIVSHTLHNCIEYGMDLTFLTHEEYAQKDTEDFIAKLHTQYKKCLIIPEGGYHPAGARGAALIMDLIHKDSSHICTAVGTATTLAGLLQGATERQQVIGIPVLKGMTDIDERIFFLTSDKALLQKLFIADGYHCGGYAKKNEQLLSFMNLLYNRYQLPTDFVYTAKMMFGIFEMIRNDFFAAGSKIVCLHTGGMQGNLSLPNGSLTFK